MKRSPLLLAVALCVAACGRDQASISASVDQTSAAALAAPEATLTFRSDWSNVLSGPLVQGGKVRVSYDGTRLPQCRGDDNGRPAWAITGYAQVNGGAVQTLDLGPPPVSGAAPPVVDLPASGSVAFWFQVTNKWGCTAWDSNYGRNFVFDVGSATRIVFASDWSETLLGRPGASPVLLIDYDLQRLPSCRQTYNGLATWDVLVSWRVDGGPVQSQSVTRIAGSDRLPNPASLAIPPGARELELWFMASDRAGCVQWDSDYGRNYRWQLN